MTKIERNHKQEMAEFRIGRAIRGLKKIEAELTIKNAPCITAILFRAM
jgi:hypothetical protein